MKPIALNFIQETDSAGGQLWQQGETKVINSGFKLTCGSGFENADPVPDPGRRICVQKSRNVHILQKKGSKCKKDGSKSSVGDPDPHVLGLLGSISQRYGSGSGFGYFPFHICVERTEIMPKK
jgi:hypothetical protein